MIWEFLCGNPPFPNPSVENSPSHTNKYKLLDSPREIKEKNKNLCEAISKNCISKVHIRFIIQDILQPLLHLCFIQYDEFKSI